METDEAWLRSVCETPAGPYLRPFAPNPRWRDASVFLMGTNPATPLRGEFGSFDEYWRGLTAEPEIFYRRYRAQHARGESKSTARARRFLEHLAPINCLVTNAYAYPARKPSQIPGMKDQRALGRAIFTVLIGLCRPTAIIFYGAEAVGLGSEIFGVALDPYTPLLQQRTEAALPGSGKSVSLWAYPHFSGQGVRAGFRVGMMGDELRALAGWLKERLGVAWE